MMKQNAIISTLLLVLAGSTIFLSSCATQQADTPAINASAIVAPTTAPIDMIVTGSADGAPEGCTAETVGERLVDMAAAVNNADSNAAQEFFGRGQWYCTVEGGQPFTAYTAAELESHLQRRYAQHEQWQVASVQVSGWEQTRRIIHFGVVIWRTADDLAKPFESMGKGAYSCEQQQFVVLCLGGETETAH